MTKDAIIKRIQQLAAERGGHVGFDTFVKETGIKDKWLRTQEWWTGWNNLLSEIGLETRKFGKQQIAHRRSFYRWIEDADAYRRPLFRIRLKPRQSNRLCRDNGGFLPA